MTSFHLPIWFDIAATFLMAMTGVWSASQRGYDAIGAFVMAFVSGAGGGLLRDSIFLVQEPAVMHDWRYFAAITAALVVGGVTQRIAQRFERLMAYVDAVAIGAYGVFGTTKALGAGIPPSGALLVGMCNAVGGGLLRDVLVRQEPLMFKPGQVYVLAALAGCVVFLVLIGHDRIETQMAAAIAIAVTLALRVLAIRFNWRTSAVSGWHFPGGRNPG